MIGRLAWRSIWRNRRRTFITLSSIGLGFAFALFSISLGEGVYKKLIDDVTRMQAGHVTLENSLYREAPATDLLIMNTDALRAQIEELPYVRSTKLLILGQGVSKSGAGAVGVVVVGVEPSVERESSPLTENLVAGKYLDDEDGPLAVVGSGLARRLKLTVGKKFILTTNDTTGALVEEIFRVKGVFETGSEEIDTSLIDIPLGFARILYGIPDGSATQLGVILKKSEQQKKAVREIRERVRDQYVSVLPWQEVIPEVASYIRLDRGSNFVFQGILIFLIMFTIFNTILMSVLERKTEFAVLLALGTPPLKLQRQLIMETAFIGLIGCALGTLIGGIPSYAVQVWGIDFSFLYKEGVNISGFLVSPKVYARVTWSMIAKFAGTVFAATLLLCLFPMRRATTVPMVELLR